jgi:hypothetical protein
MIDDVLELSFIGMGIVAALWLMLATRDNEGQEE